MCSKWAPRRCRHVWIRWAKFLMTLPHSSLGIALIAAVIAAFMSGTVWGLLPYILSLRYPHRKKSGGFKSGECGDHCGPHLRLISRSGKRCCSHANDSFEVWGVSLSCWNHWRTLTTPSPSTMCCPELAKHLDIPLGVDCHRPLVVVLEPKWSNDAMFGDGKPGSALHRV